MMTRSLRLPRKHFVGMPAAKPAGETVRPAPQEHAPSACSGETEAAGYVINPEKQELIEADGRYYRRMAIRTHVFTRDDNLIDAVRRYAEKLLLPGDILFLSEKAVACTQHRAIPLTDIHPRPLARFLCRFVHKTPCGIGLGIPETMEMALRECGTPRILAAAVVSAFGKLIGRHGWFYRIAGPRAASIDGPCPCTIPPYNHCVVLGPENPDETAQTLAEALGCPVAIVDINDLGAAILGASEASLDRGLLCRILRDNPLGQGRQSTPLGIIRGI